MSGAARTLVAALVAGAGVLAAAPAQPSGPPPRIGYLSPLSASADASRFDGLVRGLRELGYVEGRTIVIERRFAEGNLDRLPVLATELVRARVALIVAAGGGRIAQAARNATPSIPIVTTNVEDPVANGLVVSLARPGGNVTGMAALLTDLSAKRLELLRQVVPGATRVAVLWNADYPEKAIEYHATQPGARSLGIQLQPLTIRTAEEIDAALDKAVRGGSAALITLPDPLTNTHRARIVDAAARRQLPTMFSQRPPVDAGGLMSYGPSYPELFRRAARYVDRILKGARPGELPVQQPIEFEMVINLRTAAALGLTVPPALLLRADQVVK